MPAKRILIGYCATLMFSLPFRDQYIYVDVTTFFSMYFVKRALTTFNMSGNTGSNLSFYS